MRRARGRADAWNLFAERFRTPIVHFACKMGLGSADAEDVAQETLLAFTKACRAGSYDRSKGRVSRWLFGIAHRQVLSAFGKLARREVQIGQQEGATSFWSNVPDENTASKSWDEQWGKTILEQCLRQVHLEVEPTTFRAFELTALANRPAGEVASELGITRNAVFVAKHRVLKRIRELKSDVEDLT